MDFLGLCWPLWPFLAFNDFLRPKWGFLYQNQMQLMYFLYPNIGNSFLIRIINAVDSDSYWIWVQLLSTCPPQVCWVNKQQVPNPIAQPPEAVPPFAVHSEKVSFFICMIIDILIEIKKIVCKIYYYSIETNIFKCEHINHSMLRLDASFR